MEPLSDEKGQKDPFFHFPTPRTEQSRRLSVCSARSTYLRTFLYLTLHAPNSAAPIGALIACKLIISSLKTPLTFCLLSDERARVLFLIIARGQQNSGGASSILSVGQLYQTLYLTFRSCLLLGHATAPHSLKLYLPTYTFDNIWPFQKCKKCLTLFLSFLASRLLASWILESNPSKKKEEDFLRGMECIIWRWRSEKWESKRKDAKKV